ncbi:hypothetical protein Ga0100231_018910 [Opitutaceae bacterium TAV4]|nr:hypothetical protein Ga0100231_018910 [Opitutaceae bacterium TAV4]RRK00168.1 hypothetical protein Ga0100230_019575 [Opitutaceae bacterium TAV3]
MEILIPSIESKITALVLAFRFIVFAIMVVGLVCYMGTGHPTGTAVVKTLARAIVIVAAVATMESWFPRVEKTFLSVAEYIDPGYNENPTSSADAIRESTTTNPEGQEWSWRRLNESIYQAVSNALANIFIYIGTLITVPMLILQYVLRWLLYLITPFALAIFMVPGLTGIGVRFFQQMLAIFAWPIGFALTNLVALSVWTDFRNTVGANPETVSDILYSPLLNMVGGILATIMIIVGMVSTPFVMQMLFAQGAGFTGRSGNPVTIVRGTANLTPSIQGRFGGGGSKARGRSASSTAAVALPSSPPPAVRGAAPGI